MRPLNRPMFRNGGTIKEGIMDGMKDRKAALVGDPMFPTQGGRGLYSENMIRRNLSLLDAVKQAGKQTVQNIAKKPVSVLNPAKKVGFFTNVFKKAARPVQKFIDSRIPLPKFRRPPFGQQGPIYRTPAMERAGSFVRNNKLLTGAGLIYAPSVIGTAYNVGEKVIPSVVSAITPEYIKKGVSKVTGLFGDDKAESVDPNAPKKLPVVPKGSKTGTGTGTTSTIDRDAEIEANRQRYYKLMGIDKMQRGAAYDSLIDASRAIQEEGADLKGSIKSGTLQNKIISAISKNLDRSTDLKRQIDAAILKGEIQKDINQGKNLLDAEYKRTVIDKAKSDMAGGTMQQIINDRKSKGRVVSGQDLFKVAAQTGNASNIREIIPDKTVQNYFKDNPNKTAADFFNEEIVAPAIEKGQTITPGDYIVGENILRVTEDGELQFVL
jgi:hypothetical protein